MKADRALLVAGFLLFLVGLLSGLAVPSVTNPRAGLAAHLEGVMNGTFLVAVALAWPHVHLGARGAMAARGLLLYGTWANFAATQLSAILGTSRMTPIAGAGFAGPAWAETMVDVLLMSTLTMVPGVALLAWGALAARPAVPEPVSPPR